MNQRVLITGGSGYYGSLLMRKCLERGFSCRVFDLNDAEDRPASVEFVAGDIRDAAAIADACKGVDILYHNVAQVPLARDRHLFHTVNVDGTRNMLEAARISGVKKVVYTSSSAVFGVPKKNPVNEETVPQPGEAYGRAKLEGERLCHEFTEKGVDVSIIRPRTILGHGRLGIFQILFEWIRQGSNVPVLGKGENIYQFVHADDLAEATILASLRPGGSTYNIGAEKFGSMRQTLQALCDHAKTGSRVKSVPMLPAIWGMNFTSFIGLSPLGPYHALMYGRSLYFDIAKARTELSWQPKWSSEEMLIDSYEWYLSHRDAVLTSAGGSHHRSAVKQGALGIIRRVL
jgi:nucleoside-diphosphate-sugar epimerase